MTDVRVAPAGPVRILLVDDLQNNLLALSALLQRDGIELLLAHSGAEALELLLAHHVALALVDVQMPGMDGFELAELMRGSERTRHVPIIFVTAGATDQRRIFKGYDAGAVDFLAKPIEAHILKSKVGVFIELEQQKMALARELAEKTETLRLNEMFTAMLGHDLRGPLAAIVMSAMMLERKAPDPATHRSATRMLESGQRMSRMIVEMLDLARARLGGGIPVRRELLDLLPLVQRVVDEQRTVAPEHAIALSHEGDMQGAFDADRVAQLVANLVGNAVEHGTDARVDCALDGTATDAVVLTVANAGRIPDAVLPQLFDPFRGRDAHKTRGDGLGLGLYIAEQIAKAHGGTVEASAAPDDRVVFRARLPRG